MQWLLRRVVHVAIAERPVLAIHLDQVDPDIFLSYACLRVYAVRHRAVKRLLHLNRAAGVPCHLDKYDPRRVGYAQVTLRRVDQFVRRMTRDDLKLVVFGHFDDIDHYVVHDVADCLNDFRRCSLREIDSNEWHGLTSGLSWESGSAGHDISSMSLWPEFARGIKRHRFAWFAIED